MTYTDPSIELISFSDITRFDKTDRERYAEQLSTAAGSNGQLERELPIPANSYSNKRRASKRIARIGKIMAAQQDTAFFGGIITEEETGIGVASAQIATPGPELLPTAFGVELSYWHRDMQSEDAIIVGRKVLSKLLEVTNEQLIGPTSRPFGSDDLGAKPYRFHDFTKWMVTLPEDGVKSRAGEDIGFHTVGEPQRYDIEDEVTIPRQLWIW